MSDGPVIDFAAAKREIRLRTVRKMGCKHERVTIDEYTLDIECVDCERRVEPAHVLLQIARREMNLLWSHQDNERLRREAEGLKAEIRRLKQQRHRGRVTLGTDGSRR